MALIIGTNMASLNAQRHLSGAQGKAAVAMERLSTGMRVNTGKDDAAGLAIGSRLGAQVRSANQAVRNANDGISIAKAGDSALQEMTRMLERMRELATEMGDGALTAADKANISTEMNAIGAELTAIEGNAKFGSSILLGGLTISFTVGVGAADTYTLTSTAVATAVNSVSDVDAIDTAIGKVTTARAEFGSAMTALESRSNNTAAIGESLAAARSQIMDTDIAQETANMTTASVLQQAGIAVLAQANQAPNMVLSLLR